MAPRIRAVAAACAVVALVALLLPQPASAIVFATEALVFVAAASAVPSERTSRLFAAGLALTASLTGVLGFGSLAMLIGAALVSSCALKAMCAYCVTRDIAAAWRRVAAH